MAGPKSLRQVISGDGDTLRLQQNVQHAIGELLRNPLLDCILLENVSLASGNTQVSHKLGRAVRGWILVDRTNASTIYRAASDDRFLTLNSSGAVTVNILVF